jgi:bifunctional UDP-N-acetylglucosamine pyrophosphorylase/glucosamine-1-phosphate N-acetyltransferase
MGERVAVKGMAIILAAGEGKRMRSSLPKVLHEVAGEPLLAHVGRAARASGVDRIVAVVGKGAEQVAAAFAGESWEFVEQTERLGTADAVRRAGAQLADFAGDVLVLAGDTPLLRGETLAELRRRHHEVLPNPHGYGRILRDATGEFVGIVEEKDATEQQRAVREVNSSVYCFEAGALRSALGKIGKNNAQGEYYLTDAVGILRSDGQRVLAVPAATPEEILGVNTVEQLAEIREILARRRAGAQER